MSTYAVFGYSVLRIMAKKACQLTYEIVNTKRVAFLLGVKKCLSAAYLGCGLARNELKGAVA
jgi:hypothetical protein